MMQYLSTFSNATNSHFPIKLFMPHFCINLVKLIEFSLSDLTISIHFTCKVSLYIKKPDEMKQKRNKWLFAQRKLSWLGKEYRNGGYGEITHVGTIWENCNKQL